MPGSLGAGFLLMAWASLAASLGVGRRVGYALGAVYTVLIWPPEGFGGPYSSGASHVSTGIVCALLFITLLTFAPRGKSLSLDRVLVARWP